MWIELSTAILGMATGISTASFLRTRHRLEESQRQRRDLVNASLVIEEERRMLELMARGASQHEVLDTLTRAIERISSGSLCTVLLLDEERRDILLQASGPSMPEDYMKAVNGLRIGPDVGACGSAAYRNEVVVVEDIASDYRFATAREFVMSYGLRSCWSVPVRDSNGSVLGTFAMYHRIPATPRPEELQMSRAAAQLAGNAIERFRAERALRETIERLNLAERVARFGIWEADFTAGTITVSKGMGEMMERAGEPLCLSVREFDALIHPDDRAAMRDAIKEVKPAGETIQSEYRFALPSGSVRWIRSQWRFEYMAGEPVRAVGAVIDITEEKNALVRLEKKRAAAEASADAAVEARRLEQDRKTILELVAKDEPLEKIAMMIANAVTRHLAGSLCSIQIELPGTGRIAVSPWLPVKIVAALHALSVNGMRVSRSPQPLGQLSDDPEWRLAIETSGNPSIHSYRAVPIVLNTRLAGLILSFFDENGVEQSRNDNVLESWGQFASLAVERRGLYEQLPFRAQYDSLTALLNRASLYERLDGQIRKANREGGSLAVVYLDLDNFKDVNDRYGHGMGDMVLQAAAGQILGCVRHTDIVARIGGDEFVAILVGIGDRAEARRVGETITDSIGQTGSDAALPIAGLRAGASFGVSIFPQDGKETGELLEIADEDMYRAKFKRRAVCQRQNKFVELPPALASA
jgi:diguanylate cyclase (GGDEF)-like protein